jgi:acyl carrier protein
MSDTEKFLDILAEHLPVERSKINDDTPITGMDSLDMLNLVFAIDKGFGVNLIGGKWEFSDFATVGDVWRLVEVERARSDVPA